MSVRVFKGLLAVTIDPSTSATDSPPSFSEVGLAWIH
jgi:hypothetical protein